MQDEYILSIFQKALKKIGIDDEIEISFESPRIKEHGDLSTNIAMKLAKELKKSPNTIATDILSNIEYDKNLIASLEIAGAGFINIRLTSDYYAISLQKLIDLGEDIGRHDVGKGKKVNVEYVSVNPTGLLHLGHGRNACIGDTLANFYEWLGYKVTREYYFNNAGNQMNNLAKSIYARYMQELGETAYPFPDDGYHGEYIKTIAQDLITLHSDKYKQGLDEDLSAIRKFGEKWCFAQIEKTLERMSIHQDVYYNEDSLYSDGKIEELLKDFETQGLSYKKDGATWLSFSKLGLADDRVIVKSTGEPTYRLPDIAYHREKFRRGFDIIVDIFGSDHIATVPDVQAGVKALGFDISMIKVFIHQFVTLTENGEQVKMSKRTGKNYTLDDLLDEVGPDVVRFFLIMRGITTHLEFDLGLAREQSDKNPVFYLQYAHARICSILQNAGEKGISIPATAELGLLKAEQEIELIKSIMKFVQIVRVAGEKGEPQLLAEYLRELASAFHVFYHDCRIIGSGKI